MLRTLALLLPVAGAVAAASWAEQTPVPLRTWVADPAAAVALAQGENPDPVVLVRPPDAPLSAMAQLGRRLFFDPSLSASGRVSCASCHSPAHAYGPPGAGPVAYGGPALRSPGLRAVPSLMYLERQPNFSIGPDTGENETLTLTTEVKASRGARRRQKTASTPGQSATNLVPQGGLFWDGRADTLQGQALGPLLSPFEMDGGSVARVAAKLERGPSFGRFVTLFGPGIARDPRLLVAEALFAIGRYEFEEISFHPYTSKYDAWLEGKARFTPTELRGYLAFNDPQRGNCAACHLDRPTPDGLPPLFTDHQYEALGVPRNTALPANRDPHYDDLGLCGPLRTDLRRQTQYCGLFATPTLRNVATRHVFFHNGVYHSLRRVVDFYDFRATEPQKVYPRGPDGTLRVDDDLPPRDRRNVDVADAPFDLRRGQTPPLSPADERDIVAFLETLTDGYLPRAALAQRPAPPRPQ